jgi:hypothetical protein
MEREGKHEEDQGEGHAVRATAQFVCLVHGLPDGLGCEASVLDDALFEEDVNHVSSAS